MAVQIVAKGAESGVKIAQAGARVARTTAQASARATRASAAAGRGGGGNTETRAQREIMKRFGRRADPNSRQEAPRQGLSLPIFIMAFLLALVVDIISLVFGALIALFGIGAPLVGAWRMVMSPFVAILMFAGGARGLPLIIAAFGGFLWSTAAVIGVYVKGTVLKPVLDKLPAGGAAGQVLKTAAKT